MSESWSTARLAAIHTYPVKGGHRLDHAAAVVEAAGLVGDRRWMVVDPAGTGITQRETTALVQLRPGTYPGGLTLRAADLEDLDVAEPVDGEPVLVRVFSSREPVPARSAGRAADEWVSALLARSARLVWLEAPSALPERRSSRREGDRVGFADAYPLLLTTTASLDALNGWLAEAGEAPVPMTRFRPNLEVEGTPAWAEDGWVDRRLRIGSVTFRTAGSCDRCVVTTVDQETGEKGRQPLRALGQYRNVNQELLFGVHMIPDVTGKVAVGDLVEPLP